MLQELGAFLDAFAINFIFVYLLVALYVIVTRHSSEQPYRSDRDYERHF
uniref:ORF5a protein n=1 Tax=Mikumi yellow baboon virus 1 TaxID=1546177 RepID=A0A089FYF3_9NIDO|nr:ORF5a protein [Mikumi yellow baboon virus 1]